MERGALRPQAPLPMDGNRPSLLDGIIYARDAPIWSYRTRSVYDPVSLGL